MKTFEYRVVYSDSESTESKINGLGAEGWELVAVTDNGEYSAFYFKREISAEGSPT